MLDETPAPEVLLNRAEVDAAQERYDLAHDEGLSVRGIVRRLAEEHAIRRAVGTVAGYLAQPCSACVQVGQSRT
jgi:hypothetical protein